MTSQKHRRCKKCWKNYYQLNEAKRPPFCRQHFCFPLWKLLWFKFVTMGAINNNPPIGSDNGLVLSRQHVIIWTNDGLVYGRIHEQLDLNELKCTTSDERNYDIDWKSSHQALIYWTGASLHYKVKYFTERSTITDMMTSSNAEMPTLPNANTEHLS